MVNIPKFFGTAGIRGKYLELITPQLAFNIGLSYGTYLGNSGKVVVGGDVRLTTPLLKSLISSGLMVAGVDVFDLGIVPISLIGYVITKLKLKGGIYVTASHNPPEDNGFKIFNFRGSELTSSEEEEVEDILLNKKYEYVTWNKVGSYSYINYIVKDYIKDIIHKMRPDRTKLVPKIVVDTANGAASAYTPVILRELGAKVLAINSHHDGTFPSRLPEPRPDVMEPLLNVIKSTNFQFLYAHDGDGDRLAVLTARKGFIKQDRIIALFAYHKLLDKKGHIVVSIDCGNAVKDVVEKMGGKLIVYRLGKTYEKVIELGRNNVLLAAEPWKFIEPTWGLWADGVLQATYLTKIMIEEGKPLDDLLNNIPDYPQARISIFLDNKVKHNVAKKAMEYLESKAPPSAKIIKIDGLRVNYEDKSWILIRPSGTEPKIRVYGEALKYHQLKSMVNEIVKYISKLAKELGYSVTVEGSILP